MTEAPSDIRDILAILLGGGTVDERLAERLFELILTGQVNDAQLGAVLACIAVRGAHVDEIVAGVRVLRRHMTPFSTLEARTAAQANGHTAVVLDTCGTGGSPKVFNISTVAAFVVAAAAPGKVLVAKHGGRSRTGRGSAEVLERLGVNIEASPEVQARCLAEIGIAFSFAPRHHPAMRHAATARKSLGFPTIFNLIGPLSNPGRATHQLIGTFDPVVARSLAEALRRLGTARAMVVTSQDGFDELTTTSASEVFEVTPAGVRERVIEPIELGFSRRSINELRAETLDEAAAVFQRVLNGEHGACRDVVELNAAAGLMVAGVASEMREGLALAREGIDSGRAHTALSKLRELSNTP